MGLILYEQGKLVKWENCEDSLEAEGEEGGGVRGGIDNTWKEQQTNKLLRTRQILQAPLFDSFVMMLCNFVYNPKFSFVIQAKSLNLHIPLIKIM